MGDIRAANQDVPQEILYGFRPTWMKLDWLVLPYEGYIEDKCQVELAVVH